MFRTIKNGLYLLQYQPSNYGPQVLSIINFVMEFGINGLVIQFQSCANLISTVKNKEDTQVNLSKQYGADLTVTGGAPTRQIWLPRNQFFQKYQQ